MNRFSLKDKVIIITGASGGIGGAIAQAAASAGACVCMSGRNRDKLAGLLDTLPNSSSRIYEFDLKDEIAISEAVKKIAADYGRIDGLVHAAGFEITKPIRKTRKDDFQELFQVNTVSAFSLMREILKQKRCIHNSLSFVVISSVMGILGERGKVAYCASKGALISSVKALSLEIAPQEHRVNCISPGMVETELTRSMMEKFSPDMVKSIEDQHPLGFGKPEDIAHITTFLLSDEARWITGSNLIIDGGYSAR